MYTKALELDELCIAKTFLMIHNETNELIGFFSLSTDTVELTVEEKGSEELSEEASRKGYGSFILDIVNTFAFEVNEKGAAFTGCLYYLTKKEFITA